MLVHSLEQTLLRFQQNNNNLKNESLEIITRWRMHTVERESKKPQVCLELNSRLLTKQQLNSPKQTN